MSAPLRLLIMAGVMTGVLIAMAAGHAVQRAGGTEVRLDMLAVDPRDPLLGHYVVIETGLHRLDLNAYGPTQVGFRRGGDVFVTLLRDEATGAWSPASVHHRHPGEGVVIRGKVERVFPRLHWVEGEDGERVRGPERRLGELHVRYNLERYYASRDEALALEDMREGGRLRLIVSVSASGDAVIRGLEIDGEERLDRLF